LTKKGSSCTERKIFTYDKAKEFCGHQELSQKLGADFYFATPYHSWERGLNEPTNGLLRQFFPKGTRGGRKSRKLN
jgi:IS30 family transposase